MSSTPIKDIALTFIPQLGTRAAVHLLEGRLRPREVPEESAVPAVR